MNKLLIFVAVAATFACVSHAAPPGPWEHQHHHPHAEPEPEPHFPFPPPPPHFGHHPYPKYDPKQKGDPKHDPKHGDPKHDPKHDTKHDAKHDAKHDQKTDGAQPPLDGAAKIEPPKTALAEESGKGGFQSGGESGAGGQLGGQGQSGSEVSGGAGGAGGQPGGQGFSGSEVSGSGGQGGAGVNQSGSELLSEGSGTEVRRTTRGGASVQDVFGAEQGLDVRGKP